MYVVIYATIILVAVAPIIADVTEKDLEEQLGIDLSGAKSVTWKDWVNGNTIVAANKKQCNETIIGEYNGCCDDPSNNQLTNANSDKKVGKQCKDGNDLRCLDGVCSCKHGMVYHNAKRKCIRLTTKELGQSCSNDTDSCYAAFARCINGKCQCMEGFTPFKEICKRTDYICPYKSPYKVNGLIWPCKKNTLHSCPTNYSCMIDSDTTQINASDRPIYLTNSGVQQSFCCPNIPKVATSDNLQKFCLFGGKPWTDDNCPQNTSHDNDEDSNFNCCPVPCFPYSNGVTIVNGKCNYER